MREREGEKKGGLTDTVPAGGDSKYSKLGCCIEDIYYVYLIHKVSVVPS